MTTRASFSSSAVLCGVAALSASLSLGCTSLLGDDFAVKPSTGGSSGSSAGSAGFAGASGIGGKGGAGAGTGGAAGESGTAGASGGGQSGNAGQGGNAGVSGNAGQSGNAGSGGDAGQSGNAGNAGTAGAAGDGGAAGNGGMAGLSGNGGVAGQAGTAGIGGGGNGGSAGAPTKGHPEINAEYVLACFLPTLPELRPLLFSAVVKSPQDSANVVLSLRLLRTNSTNLSMRADNAVYNVSGVVADDGTYSAEFLGTVEIPDSGNPFTNSDSEFALPSFTGRLVDPERVCGRVSGNLTKPIGFPIKGAPCVFEAVGADGSFVAPGNANCDPCPAAGTAPPPGASKGSPDCTGASPDLGAAKTLISGRFTAVTIPNATFCNASNACKALSKRLAAPDARELQDLADDLHASPDFDFENLSLLVGFRQQPGYTTTDSPWCTLTDNPVHVVSFPTTHYVLDDRGTSNTENGEADCGSVRFKPSTGLEIKDVSCTTAQTGFVCEDLPPGSGGAGGGAGASGSSGAAGSAGTGGASGGAGGAAGSSGAGTSGSAGAGGSLPPSGARRRSHKFASGMGTPRPTDPINRSAPTKPIPRPTSAKKYWLIEMSAPRRPPIDGPITVWVWRGAPPTLEVTCKSAAEPRSSTKGRTPRGDPCA